MSLWRITKLATEKLYTINLNALLGDKLDSIPESLKGKQ
jgi:hypothetical protein